MMLMCALHAGLQNAHLPAPDAVDPGNVWGFARMRARFLELQQQQPPEEAGIQQRLSPKQLQELLHKQQVCPMGYHHWHWVWSASASCMACFRAKLCEVDTQNPQ